MFELDYKDKKILYYLSINSRQSFSKIGKKVGLHRNNVIKRVNKLKKKGVIFKYFTHFDPTKLGYNIVRFYFVFQYITPNIKRQIIKEFVDNKYTFSVNSCEGNINLSIYFLIKNIYNFQKLWDKIYNKYRDYFSKTYFSFWCNAYYYNYTFLIDDKTQNRMDINNVMRFGGGTTTDIDDLDMKLLRIIFSNARLPTLTIAKKLEVTTATINNRMRILEKKGVINGYCIWINFSELDYNLYKLDIYLKDSNLKKKINDYIVDNPHIRSHYISLGYSADLEYEIILKNVNQLHEFMERVMIKFPNIIKNYTYFHSLKNHKLSAYDLFPDMKI
jgi:DNA-binding Lrp family transcriptional regulator